MTSMAAIMNPRDRADTTPAPPPTAEVSLLAGRSRFLELGLHGGHETKEMGDPSTALIHVVDGGEALADSVVVGGFGGGEALADSVVVGGFGDGEATPPPLLAPPQRSSVASMLRASQLLVTKPVSSARSFAKSLRIGGKHASAVAAAAEMGLAGGGGLRDPGAASASGPPRACCFHATKVSDLWPVGLFTLVLMCGASFAVGAALDLDFFDELVFYSALFPLLILIPWALMMLRFALLVGTRSTAAEDVLDLAVFVVFFLLIHYVAMGVFGIEWGFASSQGFRYENSANQMSSQVRPAEVARARARACVCVCVCVCRGRGQSSIDRCRVRARTFGGYSHTCARGCRGRGMAEYVGRGGVASVCAHGSCLMPLPYSPPFFPPLATREDPSTATITDLRSSSLSPSFSTPPW